MTAHSDRLKVSTPSDREIVMTREFDASRERVWEAMTDPGWLERWLTGPEGWSMTSCEDDQRAGGEFRWEWGGPDGEKMAIKGEYREVTRPSRVVRTESFEFDGEDQPGRQVATAVLTERGAKTLLTLTARYDSKDARDGALMSGMELGVGMSYDRMAAMLGSE